MHTCFDSVFIFTICEKKYEIVACIINVYTGKNNRFPFLDILGYLKNTHKNPKFKRVRQVPPRKLVGNSLVGTCLSLPNLGFLWVFFKYPKISNIGNLLFFPVYGVKWKSYPKLDHYFWNSVEVGRPVFTF